MPEPPSKAGVTVKLSMIYQSGNAAKSKKENNKVNYFNLLKSELNFVPTTVIKLFTHYAV